MLYYLFYPLREYFSFFNIFRYITFRSAFAAVTALCISVFIGPLFIRYLTKIQALETINKDHKGIYDKHKSKKNTPTMGGIIILASILVSVLLWTDLSNLYVQIGIITLVWLGALGFIDDYMKCMVGKSKGLSKTTKLVWQLALSLIITFLLFYKNIGNCYTIIPFFKSITIYMGYWYLLFVLFVIVGTSNAVNLTDGLDGLATGCVIMSAFAYAVMAYIAGHFIFSSYLNLPFVKGAGELTVFCTSIMGAGLGFLWYNAGPAEVFMGDTGALSLGGIIGVIAIMIKQELLLVIVGGVFVIETLSVIIQVIYFKTTGKRFFLVAPIHHHFEMKGLSEGKIVTRFWILAIIFAVMSLCTLKIR